MYVGSGTNLVNEMYPDTNLVNEMYPDTNLVNEMYPDTSLVNEIYPDTNLVNEIQPIIQRLKTASTSDVIDQQQTLGQQLRHLSHYLLILFKISPYMFRF